MEKTFRLKIAAMILFWFGIILELFGITLFLLDYRHGMFEGMNISFIYSLGLLGIGLIVYDLFVHVIHIIAGLLLSWGKIGGIILGLIVSLYEIIAFLLPDIDPLVFTPAGASIRILFVFVIFLIISDRKKLASLQSENWRPWKNPLSGKPKDL